MLFILFAIAVFFCGDFVFGCGWPGWRAPVT
jgi:predicted small metal-binding protein